MSHLLEAPKIPFKAPAPPPEWVEGRKKSKEERRSLPRDQDSG